MKLKNILIILIILLSFIGSASAVSLTINGGTQTLGGNYTYDYVNITNGGILYITTYDTTGTTGTLNLNVLNSINVDATSSINGAKRGYLGGSGYCGYGPYGGCGGTGPGAGGGGTANGDSSGSGGGGPSAYGISATGAGGNYGAPGTLYGTTSGTDIQMGSGGGSGGKAYVSHGVQNYQGDPGQAGGSQLKITASNINIFGTITMIGGEGGRGGKNSYDDYGGNGGGASGGGILINGTNVNISGSTLTTAGGAGISSRVGTGGRIKIFYQSSFTNTSTTVTSGTVYYLNTNTPPTVPTITFPINSTSSYTNTTTHMNWTASTDAEGNSINYTWQFSNTADFSNILNTSTTSNNYSTTITYPIGSYYYMRVKAVDSLSASSAWSGTIEIISAKSLTLLTPTNGYIGTDYSYVTLTWVDIPYNPLYTYQISDDSSFTNIVVSGTTSGQSIGTFTLLPTTKYYWHVKNATSAYTSTFNFTTSSNTSIPGALNLSVYSESNMSLQILNYTAEIYDIYGNFSSFITTNGWVNITNITSGTHYARVFNATGTNATYYERTVSFDSPANVTVYLPPTSTGLLIVFVLNDYTGDYPYLSTTLTVARNGTTVYSSLFGADAKIPTYLSQGISYTITLTNDGHTIIWGNYLPYVSTEVSIAVTTKVIPQGALNYNISNNPSAITLQWNAESGNFIELNFTIYNAITGALLDSTTTSLTTGEYNYAKGVNNLSYYVVFNGSTLNDGIFIKKTTFDDRTVCEKAPGTMICKNDFMSYGTYTISDSWRYSISIIGLILLAVSFTIYFAYEGAIITLIFANFLYYWEWLPHMSFLGLDTGQGFFMVLLVLALIMLGKNKGE